MDRIQVDVLNSRQPADRASQAWRTLGLLEELRLLQLAAQALGYTGASAGRMAVAGPAGVLVAGYALPQWHPREAADDKNVCSRAGEKNLSFSDQDLTDLFLGSGIEFVHDTPVEETRSFVRSNRACLPGSRGALALEQDGENYRSAAHYMNTCPESSAELALYSEAAEEADLILFPSEEAPVSLPGDLADAGPGGLIDLEAERLRRMTPAEARRHHQAAMLGRIENDYILKLLGIF